MRTFAALVFLLLPTMACAGRPARQTLPPCTEPLKGVVYTYNGKDKRGEWRVACSCQEKEKRFVWVNERTKKAGTETSCPN